MVVVRFSGAGRTSPTSPTSRVRKRVWFTRPCGAGPCSSHRADLEVASARGRTLVLRCRQEPRDALGLLHERDELQPPFALRTLENVHGEPKHRVEDSMQGACGREARRANRARNVRARSSAHGRYVDPARFGASSAGAVVSSGAVFARGLILARHALAGASTPAYFTVWNLGGGTLAAKRQRSESGSMSTATVPSRRRVSGRCARGRRAASRAGPARAGTGVARRSASRPPRRERTGTRAACSVDPSARRRQLVEAHVLGERGARPRSRRGPAGGTASETASSVASPSSSVASASTRRRRYFSHPPRTAHSSTSPTSAFADA